MPPYVDRVIMTSITGTPGTFLWAKKNVQTRYMQLIIKGIYIDGVNRLNIVGEDILCS
jgi:hypothetical protein